ncbi:MAG: hypothetical protein G8237_00335 [Magnetococcales bacterium]|nr:hypothetical protein [Magnetococcales bacterium]NGZ04786.1 hypothetical protein [Magnetococcales bacterium]
MNPSLWRAEVFPFALRFGLLLVATLLGDLLLHQFGLVWVGRYLGIPGTLLIVISLLYSARKRKKISVGNPRVLLRWHEWATWAGSLMIFIHAGVHFHAILPWLATLAMVVNVISGLVGRYLLDRSRRHLAAQKQAFVSQGLSEVEVEKEVFWDAVACDLMHRWRIVHFPVSLVFAILAVGHIVSVLAFWGWR